MELHEAILAIPVITVSGRKPHPQERGPGVKLAA